MKALWRVILDTNVMVRALINVRSDSGRLLVACEKRTMLAILSKPVLAEYRLILTSEEIVSRYRTLTRAKVRVALERLVYVADVIEPVTAKFRLPRDPKDEKWVELAITGRATHLVTTDADLLDLKEGRDDAARRFRQRCHGVEVLEPRAFLDRYEKVFGRLA